ncbi:MAG: hypothetical protein ACLFQL_13165 [Paracoccaceae bacterium]
MTGSASKQNTEDRRKKSREDRLKAALKANLARRKEQARARDEGADDTGKSSDKGQ